MFEIDLTLEDTVVRECSYCGTTVQMEPLGERQHLKDRCGTTSEYAALYRCQVCKKPAMLSYLAKPIPNNPDEELTSLYSWLPEPRSRKEYGPEIPEKIAEVAKEAHLCHSVGAYRAAVVLYRTALEAALKDQDITGKTLNAKIEELAKHGLVHPKIREGMDALRKAGNIAVHDETKLADPQTESHSHLFLKVLDIVLDGLYTKPQIIQEAVQRVEELEAKQDPSVEQKEQP